MNLLGVFHSRSPETLELQIRFQIYETPFVGNPTSSDEPEPSWLEP